MICKKDIKIADDYTVADWFKLKEQIEADSENVKLWYDAFGFFEKRLRSRYLQPIKVIENNSNIDGEGFSIVAIICSMIEALESFYQGKSYRKPIKGHPLDEETEYYRSKPIFESFLNNREPFNKYFSKENLSSDFYENVRCAILHEAATRNGWKIRVDTKSLIEKQGDYTVINRALFVQKIEDYIANYKDELMNSVELKKAYIRKFDTICETV